MKEFLMKNICLVTEELAGIHGAGGIGAAFSELALLLAAKGHNVDILYCPIADMTASEKTKHIEDWAARRVRFSVLALDKYVWSKSYEAKSYAVYQELKDRNYDYIHFHDYKALGFASVSSKHQGHSFLNTSLVVQMHGPSCWTLDINKSMYSHEDQLKIDFMEREMVSKADKVVSPSAYLLDYLSEKQDFTFPKDVRVIKNSSGNIVKDLNISGRSRGSVDEIDEIVFFARHEERKGIINFCDALDRLNDYLSNNGLQVTFLGKFGQVQGKHSGIYLAERARRWNFSFKLLTDFHRNEAVRYLISNKRSLVVIPSEENSPYTVLESLCMKKPILTSQDGGNKELIDKKYHSTSLCDCSCGESLYKGIKSLLGRELPIPELDESTESIDAKWLGFHEESITASAKKVLEEKPRVTLGITHYERPEKLIDAVMSAIKQTYENIEIVVIDDGSKKPETLAALDYVEALLKKVSGKLIRSENGYLGAARNKIVKNTESKYLCFLDDDDIMKSNLVEKLVLSAESSNAEVINCVNQFMDISRRSEGIAYTDNFHEKVSYVPIGGPLSVGYFSNCLGSATALIRRDFFEKIGGYTELKAVGHEDYELFVNVLQNGGKIEVMPEPLYLYEVGRPSMISSTPVIRNFKRISDAILIEGNEKAVREFMRMKIGRKAVEFQINSTNWRLQQDTNGELINEITNGKLEKDDLREALIDYARRIDSFAFADALSRHDKNNQTPLKSLPKIMKNGQHDWNGVIHFNSLISEAKHEVFLGRQDKVCTLIAKYIKRYNVFDSNIATLVAQLKEGTDFSRESARYIYELIEVSTIEAADEDLKLSLFNLARIIGDDELISSLIRVYAADEEADYLHRYGDVKENIEKGIFDSGLSHFLRFGQREGRVGYKYSSICYNKNGPSI